MSARAETKRGLLLQATSNGVTELDAVVTRLPWGDGFDFRKGIDAVTGSLMPSAIEPATPVERTVKNSAEAFRFIQSESELDTEVETSASGKYNIGGVALSASAQYLQKIKYSELSMTLIASYKSEFEGYDELQSPQLTAQAKGLIGDHAKFRKQYGDYFVHGGKRGSNFYAVYVLQSTTTKSMQEFKATVGASTPDVFSAEGSARFMKAASDHNVKISVDVYMNGYTGKSPGGPWTPDKVIEALEWFKQHETGDHVQAELAHYSSLDPSYPRTVDIEPEIFVALRKLYTTVFNVRALYGSCPTRYQKQFTNSYNDLTNGVMASQSRLATDANLRADYQQKAETLQMGLNQVFDRMDFYFKVRDAVGTEPGQGSSIDDSGRQSYLYGYASYTRSSAVTINADRQSYAEDWHIGWREHTFEWEHQDRLIVGWEVVSNWHDGTNGSWKKESDTILLRHRAQVYVTSLYDRGCNWTLNVFWVEAKDYDFG
ncbi:MAG TPA: hypothetical protein VF715_01220 [Thermoleophilaceae bacterium]|jgi:hypothetical protein